MIFLPPHRSLSNNKEKIVKMKGIVKNATLPPVGIGVGLPECEHLGGSLGCAHSIWNRVRKSRQVELSSANCTGRRGETKKGMRDMRDREGSKGGGERRERAGRLGRGCLIVHVPPQRERRKRKLTCTEKLFCLKTFCVEVFNSLNHS